MNFSTFGTHTHTQNPPSLMTPTPHTHPHLNQVTPSVIENPPTLSSPGTGPGISTAASERHAGCHPAPPTWLSWGRNTRKPRLLGKEQSALIAQEFELGTKRQNDNGWASHRQCQFRHWDSTYHRSLDHVIHTLDVHRRFKFISKIQIMSHTFCNIATWSGLLRLGGIILRAQSENVLCLLPFKLVTAHCTT